MRALKPGVSSMESLRPSKPRDAATTPAGRLNRLPLTEAPYSVWVYFVLPVSRPNRNADSAAEYWPVVMVVGLNQLTCWQVPPEIVMAAWLQVPAPVVASTRSL